MVLLPSFQLPVFSNFSTAKVHFLITFQWSECLFPDSYVEILTPSVMVLGGKGYYIMRVEPMQMKLLLFGRPGALGLSVPHHLPKLVRVHVHGISDAIRPSHPLTPSSPALSLSQHQGLFQWVLDGSHCFNPNPKVLFYFIHHMYHITSPPIGLTLLFTIPTPDSVPGTFSAPSVSCGHCNTLAKLSGLQEHKCIIVQFWRSGAQDQSRC